MVYIGHDPVDMTAEIKQGNHVFSYEIIDIRRYDYEKFLEASIPEEVILAILGDFHGTKPESVINQILRRLREPAQTDLAFGKYSTQLEVISELRELRTETKNK